MARGGKKKKGARRGSEPTGRSAGTAATYPYTITPAALRRFLEFVPQKPKPTKVNHECLKAWGLRNTNDRTILRVLKYVGLIGTNNEPTPLYTEFMKLGTGPAALAGAIRSSYAKIFEHSNEPYRESDDALRNYFNIHSGGSEDVVARQVQTFKVLCEHADFKGVASGKGAVTHAGVTSSAAVVTQTSTGQAAIHIDLHIHLPENKSRRDYEYMFEDIARHIFGRDIGKESGEQS